MVLTQSVLFTVQIRKIWNLLFCGQIVPKQHRFSDFWWVHVLQCMYVFLEKKKKKNTFLLKNCADPADMSSVTLMTTSIINFCDNRKKDYLGVFCSQGSISDQMIKGCSKTFVVSNKSQSTINLYKYSRFVIPMAKSPYLHKQLMDSG